MVSSSNSQLGVTLVAKDSISTTLKRVEGSTRNLDKAFGSLGARMKTGFQMHVLNNALGMLDRAFRRVTDALPDLIRRGEQWAATVDEITDATGMSAAQASELAAIQARVGGSTEALTKGFAAMARSVTDNAADWKEMNVAISRNRDGSVDAYGTFQNLRRGISATGASLLSTAAAQRVLSRGGKEMLDLLQLTDREFRALARDARVSGLIMTEAGLAAAEQWGRTQKRMDLAITGVGSQLLNALAPTFIGITNAVTDTIQKNMGQIVRFVSGAVSWVAGLLEQFLGVQIDIELPAVIKDVGDNADVAGKKLTSGAKASKGAAAANKDLAASAKALREAEKALADARAASTFGANMSRADFILAQQARQARIKDAEERVRDARKSARDHRKTMGEIADVNDAALDRMGRSWDGYTGASGPVVTGLKQTLADSKAFGRQIADSIQDAIFGPDQQVNITGGAMVSVRSGGLMGALQDAGKWMGTVSGHLSNLNGLLSGNGPLALALGALALKFGGGVTEPAGLGGSPLLAALGPAALVAMAREAIMPEISKMLPNQGISDDAPNIGLGGALGSVLLSPKVQAQLVQSLSEAIFRAPGADADTGIVQNDLLSGIAADYATGGVVGGGYSHLGRRGVAPRTPGIQGEVAPSGPSGPGRDVTGGSALGIFGAPSPAVFSMANAIFRRHLGSGSDLTDAAETSADLASWQIGIGQTTADNTAPLASGTIGTKLTGWDSGVLGAISGTVGILGSANGVTVGNPSLAVRGNVGILSTANTVSVGNTSVGVTGSVGLLTTANTVSVGNPSLAVRGNVGLLSTANTVKVGSGSVSVGGNVGLLSTANTVSVGNPTLKVGGNVGLVSSNNTIRLGAVNGGVSIVVGGTVALTEAIVTLLQDTVVNTGFIRDRLNAFAAYFGTTGVNVTTGTVPVTLPSPTLPIKIMGTDGNIPVGVQNSKIAVDNAPGTYLGMWPTGGKTLPAKVENKPGVRVENKPSVGVPAGDPWPKDVKSYLFSMSTYLGNIWREGNRTNYATFATGTPSVPQTGMALVHQGEMIIPARVAQAIRQGQASVGNAVRSAASSPIVVNVLLDSRTIARAVTSGGGMTSTLKPV